MRVLNVQLRYIHGGCPQACLDYSRMLLESGHEVVVLLNPEDPFADIHRAIGATVLVAKWRGQCGPYDLCTILYFRKLLLRVKPDVVIVHEGRIPSLMKWAAQSIAPKKGIPIIDINHGNGPRQSRRTDATIVLNEVQLRASNASLGNHHPVYKLRNAIDMSGTAALTSPKMWHQPVVIGAMARFVAGKAFDVLIDALAILKSRNVVFQAVIAGDGEERKKLEQQVRECGLDTVLTLPGWNTKPDAFYNAIDIFCCPSRAEEFGLVLLEAWKHHLPLVVTDTDGPIDIVTPDHNAIMVPKERPDALADALEKLINHKAIADDLARAGYRTLSETYAIPVVAPSLHHILLRTVQS